MKSRTILIGLCVACLPVCGRAAESAVVNAPEDLVGVWGDTSSDAPFAISSPESSRYQQVYNAELFASLPKGGGQIGAIVFRGDLHDQHYWGGTIANLQINMSVTGKAADSLSPIFSENTGKSDTIVFAPGSLFNEVSANQGPFGATTFIVRLSQPFLYDPSKGNLLLDVRNYSGGQFQHDQFEKPLLNASSSLSDGISRAFANDVNATAATTLDTIGLFTSFDFTLVPEPSTVGLVVLGGAALLAVSRTRKQTKLRSQNYS